MIFHRNANSEFQYYDNVNISIILYYKKEDNKIKTENEIFECGKPENAEEQNSNMEPGELLYYCKNYYINKTDLYRVEFTNYHFTFSNDENNKNPIDLYKEGIIESSFMERSKYNISNNNESYIYLLFELYQINVTKDKVSLIGAEVSQKNVSNNTNLTLILSKNEFNGSFIYSLTGPNENSNDQIIIKPTKSINEYLNGKIALDLSNKTNFILIRSQIEDGDDLLLYSKNTN